MKIFDKIRKAHKKQLPFVAYRKPNKDKVSALLQKDDSLNFTKDYKEEGFVFAPFDVEQDAVLIPKAISKFYSEVVDDLSDIENDVVVQDDFSSKQNHIKLIERGVKAISKGEFRKVVLSRKEVVEFSDFDIFYSFLLLLKTYSNAFVYLWYHPKVGLWMGATPETLIKIKGKTFETMSLAGTQEYKGSIAVDWKPKEIDEQQLVTDYVLQKLEAISDVVTSEEVQTIKAGNLLHLKTQIKGKFTSSTADLIETLHPTPAVCGYPKKATKDFILNYEGYNREFYTGFLGEINLPKSELFVNLRCMQLVDTIVHIYVGGGITLKSNAEKEWLETVAKTKTIKNVLG